MNGIDRDQRPHILFGYDGTEQNDAALRWAVEEARLRGLEVVICHGWHWPYASGHEDPAAEALRRRAGEHLLNRGAERATELGAPGTVHRRLLRGPVHEALPRVASTAELVVIGTSGRPDTGAARLEVPGRVERPVIVVPDRPPGPPRVVAGTDAEAGCAGVLGFAFEEAALRGWELRVVYGCWEPAAVSDRELALFNDPEVLQKTRTAELEDVVAPWREHHPDVEVTASLLMERPGAALRAAADEAGLLVLGAGGGRSGPGPLGGTSTEMLRLAGCPIAVVPG